MKENNFNKPLSQEVLRKHFIETLYETLEGVISPTPFLAVSDNDDVSIDFLNGNGLLPSPKTTEITVLDLEIASLFFDNINLLFEGVTGVGKTYSSEALFNTLFGPDGHYTLRLSGGILGGSALEPFTTTSLENGMPKTIIDQTKCEKYGGLFIDEINRGDTNEVFQIVDGKIHINGDTGYLRLPIKGTDRYKGLAIIAAMNPPNAMYNATVELDFAGENRFLKFKYPNGVSEVSSSQLSKKLDETELHESFWNNLKNKIEMDGGWLDIYPVITDSAQFNNDLNGDVNEFIDVAISFIGYNPKEIYERNAELMRQGGVEPSFKVIDDNELDKIIELQGKLKYGFVRRDLNKIKDLSQLISFIKGVKNESYEVNVTLNDVAASIGIILESKIITDADYGDLMILVNDVFKSYKSFRSDAPDGFGYRQLVFQSALTKKSFNDYLGVLNKGVRELNTNDGSVSNKLIKSRLISDLVVLKHFSKAYEGELSQVLLSDNPLEGFVELYDKHKSEASIYEHRLESIIR